MHALTRLAENLHVIDFEQLKIENQQLNVRRPCGYALQVSNLFNSVQACMAVC